MKNHKTKLFCVLENNCIETKTKKKICLIIKLVYFGRWDFSFSFPNQFFFNYQISLLITGMYFHRRRCKFIAFYILTRLASYAHWWLFTAEIVLVELFCGTMMGMLLLLFPFYRKVKKIVKLESSKARLAGEYDLVSMCSGPPGCHRSALERAEGTHNHP